MARRLGEAYVQFGQRGMDRVTASSKRSVGALRAVHLGAQKAATSVLKIGAVATVAAMAAAAVTIAQVRKQLEELDRVAKLSRNTGVSSGAIFGLGIAAEEGGASVKEMNTALEIFNQRVGQAKDRSGETRDAFAGLGISLDDLQRMDTEEVLRAVSDALKDIPDAATRADKAATLFGRSGRKLVNVIGGGADEIDRFQEKAEKFGFNFTPDELQQLEAANDAVNNLARSFQGLFAELAVEAAPAIKVTADSLVQIIQRLRTLKSQADAAKDAIISLVDKLTGLNIAGFLGVMADIEAFRKDFAIISKKPPTAPPEDTDTEKAIKVILQAQSGSASAIFKTTQAAILRKEDELLAQAKQTNEILKKIEQKPPVNVPPAVLGP